MDLVTILTHSGTAVAFGALGWFLNHKLEVRKVRVLEKSEDRQQSDQLVKGALLLKDHAMQLAESELEKRRNLESLLNERQDDQLEKLETLIRSSWSSKDAAPGQPALHPEDLLLQSVICILADVEKLERFNSRLDKKLWSKVTGELGELRRSFSMLIKRRIESIPISDSRVIRLVEELAQLYDKAVDQVAQRDSTLLDTLDSIHRVAVERRLTWKKIVWAWALCKKYDSEVLARFLSRHSRELNDALQRQDQDIFNEIQDVCEYQRLDAPDEVIASLSPAGPEEMRRLVQSLAKDVTRISLHAVVCERSSGVA